MKKVLMILLAAGFASLLGVAVVFLYLSPKGETIKEEESILTEEPEQVASEQVETEETVTDSRQSSTKPAVVKEIHIAGLKAQRLSADQIVIEWSDDQDGLISSYIVQKYDNRNDNREHLWINVGEVSTGDHSRGNPYTFTDKLESSEPQQYVYRVLPQFRDESVYVAADEPGVLCSNIKICIDPGHYAGKNEAGDGYAEGDFTLHLALELKNLLEAEYGITVCMTRDSGSISIGGYKDAALDNGHISLRGTYAAEEGCDLFVSVHTNANEENANGAGTFEQPVSIDKPIIIANDLVLDSGQLCDVCNAVGQNLAQTSYQLGISSHKAFTEVSGGRAAEWTTAYNDSTTEQGAVVCRHGSHGQYYGVLRGAEEAGVPGIIIEHGYHTVEQMRKAAMNGELKAIWADADAKGIAAGFGFHNYTNEEK